MIKKLEVDSKNYFTRLDKLIRKNFQEIKLASIYTLIRKGKITRDYINQEVDKRCSSGIVLILGQIPFVSTVRNPTSLEI